MDRVKIAIFMVLFCLILLISGICSLSSVPRKEGMVTDKGHCVIVTAYNNGYYCIDKQTDVVYFNPGYGNGYYPLLRRDGTPYTAEDVGINYKDVSGKTIMIDHGAEYWVSR